MSMTAARFIAVLLHPPSLALAAVAYCVQAALVRRFARGGLFQRDPALAAQKLVCFPLMVLVVVAGCKGWVSAQGSSSGLSHADRLHGFDQGGCLTAQLGIAVGLWDFPTYITTPSLRTPVMLAHHATTLALQVLMIGCSFLQHYGSFFFGVTELSTLPLLFVDLFRPEHFPALADRYPSLTLVLRGSFALLFLSVRVCYWPVVLMRVWADLLWELNHGAPTSISPSLIWAILAGSTFLTALQFFWGYKILQQIAKMVSGKH
eukprot:TRINITY_DN106198_c0_g1_i1.p1 TRINITY_DN106198_c0_g1~~TRINITY_DN106198_c0_g1_i1.p1  ORF type:complete len:262 (-),score=24.47 TRINITY_DN106198_c0_g1_i1:125-910(-)